MTGPLPACHLLGAALLESIGEIAEKPDDPAGPHTVQNFLPPLLGLKNAGAAKLGEVAGDDGDIYGSPGSDVTDRQGPSAPGQAAENGKPAGIAESLEELRIEKTGQVRAAPAHGERGRYRLFLHLHDNANIGFHRRFVKPSRDGACPP